jgi:hypothetical protein
MFTGDKGGNALIGGMYWAVSFPVGGFGATMAFGHELSS